MLSFSHLGFSSILINVLPVNNKVVRLSCLYKTLRPLNKPMYYHSFLQCQRHCTPNIASCTFVSRYHRTHGHARIANQRKQTRIIYEYKQGHKTPCPWTIDGRHHLIMTSQSPTHKHSKGSHQGQKIKNLKFLRIKDTRYCFHSIWSGSIVLVKYDPVSMWTMTHRRAGYERKEHFQREKKGESNTNRGIERAIVHRFHWRVYLPYSIRD